MKGVFTLMQKDLLLELRQQYTFWGILLYVASTVFVLYLAMGKPQADVFNGLFWMIQLFVCINAVAKSFLQESKGRMLYYYFIGSPTQFIIAKLIYNALISVLMVVMSLALFFFLLGTPVLNVGSFVGLAFLGAVSIGLVFTLMSAIAAKAQQNAAIMAILGFPLIIPQLLLLLRISRSMFGEVFREGALLQMFSLLVGLDVLVIVLSVVLFPFLWRE
ncbi:MAG: heme exporter protein CcmB [Chitinophagaceae bacterium]|nr:heme exporter protein CcmB [Chitinophagaceae bacterium]MCW5913870.1 heme exporter protein CcmB [Chitinophagaceae bacterium]